MNANRYSAATGAASVASLEGAIIAAGVLPLLVIVTLRQHAAAADTAALMALGSGLIP